MQFLRKLTTKMNNYMNEKEQYCSDDEYDSNGNGNEMSNTSDYDNDANDTIEESIGYKSFQCKECKCYINGYFRDNNYTKVYTENGKELLTVSYKSVNYKNDKYIHDDGTRCSCMYFLSGVPLCDKCILIKDPLK